MVFMLDENLLITTYVSVTFTSPSSLLSRPKPKFSDSNWGLKGVLMDIPVPVRSSIKVQIFGYQVTLRHLLLSLLNVSLHKYHLCGASIFVNMKVQRVTGPGKVSGHRVKQSTIVIGFGPRV